MDLITLTMAEDYSDSKGGYTETTKTVLYENAEVEFYPHENGMSLTQIIDESVDVVSVPGMVLTVHYDGADYRCELVKGDEDTLVFGNIPTGDVWDESGMPFLGMVFVDAGLSNITILVNDTAKPHIIGIAYDAETIHPIDPKYLPDGCVPVVIDLDKWGIDVASLAFGGGGKMDCYINHNAFWKLIPVNGNFLVKAALGAAASYNVPSCFAVGNGAVIGFVCSSTVEYGGSIMTIDMQFSCAFDPESGDYSDTTATVIVEQKSVPGL